MKEKKTMSMHSVTRSNVALNTANDLLTFIAAASRKIKLHEISVGGMGTASAANEIAVQRSTGGTTGGGAITPESVDPDSLADSVTVVNTTWSAQPTLSGTPLLRLPVNANGGVYRWGGKARAGDRGAQLGAVVHSSSCGQQQRIDPRGLRTLLNQCGKSRFVI